MLFSLHLILLDLVGSSFDPVVVCNDVAHLVVDVERFAVNIVVSWGVLWVLLSFYEFIFCPADAVFSVACSAEITLLLGGGCSEFDGRFIDFGVIFVLDWGS